MVILHKCVRSSVKNIKYMKFYIGFKESENNRICLLFLDARKMGFQFRF
mgnify:FL=1